MRTIFFDVDTQLDFLCPAGALAVPGAEKIVHSLAALTRFAAANRIQIISTADAHAENDREFKIWKPHCVVGTAGQHKAAGTLLNEHVILSTAAQAIEGIRSRIPDVPQIIVEKQNVDCFTNVNLRPLLQIASAKRYVLYGVATEVCVQCAAFGLLELGMRVELVTDAIKSLSASKESAMIQRFKARGGVLTTMSAVTA